MVGNTKTAVCVHGKAAGTSLCHYPRKPPLTCSIYRLSDATTDTLSGQQQDQRVQAPNTMLYIHAVIVLQEVAFQRRICWGLAYHNRSAWPRQTVLPSMDTRQEPSAAGTCALHYLQV
jgi:hypothetical protein